MGNCRNYFLQPHKICGLHFRTEDRLLYKKDQKQDGQTSLHHDQTRKDHHLAFQRAYRKGGHTSSRKNTFNLSGGYTPALGLFPLGTSSFTTKYRGSYLGTLSRSNCTESNSLHSHSPSARKFGVSKEKLVRTPKNNGL